MKTKKYSNNCPLCRENLGKRFFKDKKTDREIRSLLVFCVFKDEGCDWKGELRRFDEHVTNCPSRKVQCEQCSTMIRQTDVIKHFSDECIMREHHCPLCGEKGTYQLITTEHKDLCPAVILMCSNAGCTQKMNRLEMYAHSISCPKALVRCPYSDIGCNVKLEREKIDIHAQTETLLHFNIAVQRVRELQLKTCPVVIKFPEFSENKSLNSSWYSAGFYSSPGGYKIRLSVDAGGCGDGRSTHLSVFINIMPGDYDDNLEWPLSGEFNVEVLNQIQDKTHYMRTIKFNNQSRKYKEDENGIGFAKFISHSSLVYNLQQHTQYLMGNVLFFRVSSNILSSKTKPWLDK